MSLESAMPYVVWSFVLVVCAGIDSLFCGLETGIYEMNKIRLELRAASGHSAAIALQKLTRNFNHLLAVLLIGTNLTRYMATFAISAMFVQAGARHRAELYTLAVATPALFVIGDSVPKSVFQRMPGALVYRLVWFLRAASVLFTITGLAPLVQGFASGLLRLLGGGDRQRALGHRGIEAIVAEGRASGLLTDYQSAMADRAVRVARIRVADVLVPFDQAVVAPVDAGRDDILLLVNRYNHSRLPLCDEAGQVSGILDIYDLLIGDTDASPSDLASSPLIVGHTRPISDALVAMRRADTVMAIAADEAGTHLGIVTVKDIAEQIVGDLHNDA
ncbi:MAG: CNNM domain-containing protein [Planctomycetota bacterium]|jgi:CBS domain containing-hemolysin-like protein